MAPLRHASEHCECLLAEVFRKSGFTIVRTVFDPERTLQVPSWCLNQHERKRAEFTTINVSGLRSWSARDEASVDALQHYFAVLIAEVHLIADNTPVNLRLRLALL